MGNFKQLSATNLFRVRFFASRACTQELFGVLLAVAEIRRFLEQRKVALEAQWYWFDRTSSLASTQGSCDATFVVRPDGRIDGGHVRGKSDFARRAPPIRDISGKLLTLVRIRDSVLRELGIPPRRPWIRVFLLPSDWLSLAVATTLQQVVPVEINALSPKLGGRRPKVKDIEVVSVESGDTLFSGLPQEFQDWTMRAFRVLQAFPSGVPGPHKLHITLPDLITSLSDETCSLGEVVIGLLHSATPSAAFGVSWQSLARKAPALISVHNFGQCSTVRRCYVSIGKRLLARSRGQQASDYSDVLSQISESLAAVFGTRFAMLLANIRPRHVHAISSCELPLELLDYPFPLGTTSGVAHHNIATLPLVSSKSRSRNRVKVLTAVLNETPNAKRELITVNRSLGVKSGIASTAGWRKSRSLDSIPAFIIHLAGHVIREPELQRLLSSLYTENQFPARTTTVICNSCSSSRMLHVMRFYADSIVCTRWPITDEAALEFAGKFYHSISIGKSVAEAIVSARRSGMNTKLWEDPTWMSYTLLGEDALGMQRSKQQLASHCGVIADLHRSRGRYLDAGAWHRRAAGFHNSSDNYPLALEHMSLAEQDIAEYYRDQENFVESSRRRFRAAEILKKLANLGSAKGHIETSTVVARALSIRAWAYAELASFHFFQRHYALAARQRFRAASFFRLASMASRSSFAFVQECKAYHWEYRAWRHLALAGSSWRKSNYARSVAELEFGIACMRKAARFEIQESDRIRLNGYLNYLRALMLRSQAWFLLEHEKYSGAMEALDEAIGVLKESLRRFPLQRDSSWAEGNLLLMVAQRELGSALQFANFHKNRSASMLVRLVRAVHALQRSVERFTLQALRQRSRQASFETMQVMSYLGQGGSTTTAVRMLNKIIFNDALF